jgi:hypothetical protein
MLLTGKGAWPPPAEGEGKEQPAKRGKDKGKE